jgi:hypothetical protein
MSKKKRPKYILACIVIGCALVLGGCSTTTYNADGTVVKQEIDYTTVKLTAATTVSLWAASQKNGINEDDAEALYYILQSIQDYHTDGSEIKPSRWAEAARTQIPKRYWGLAVVATELVSYEFKKYGLSTVPLTKDSTALKLFEAIRDGAMMGIAPYTGKGKMAA